MSEIWLEKDSGARVFKREESCRFQNLKFEYIGAGWIDRNGEHVSRFEAITS